MFDAFKNYMLYAGVERSSYEKVKPKITRSNRTMVTVFSGLATVFIAIVFVISHFVEGVGVNRKVYMYGLMVSLALFLCSYIIASKFDWVVAILVDLSYSIFFMYGISIGAISNPSQQTVTFMVMLVFIPLLFVNRPFRTAILTAVFIIVFIILCLKNKSGAVLSTDIMDAIIFGILGISSGSFITHVKVKSYVLEQKLQDVSKLDRLTQMNNRNAFEIEVDELPKRCKDRIACLYIDVNGLHELNNAKGHSYGDEMLKYVADKIKQFFGEEMSYRVGGDEFIAFVTDPNEDEVRQNLADLIAAIENKNYHIATGLATAKVNYNLSMNALVKTAESIMYKDKKQYYKNFANDRSNRT